MNVYYLLLIFLQITTIHVAPQREVEFQEEVNDQTYHSNATENLHHRSKRQTRHHCSNYCQDVAGCRRANCYYDFKTLHCYKSKRDAKDNKVDYSQTAYSPHRLGICINYGGYAYTSADGWEFVQEPTWFGGHTLTTNQYIRNVQDDADQRVFQTARVDWKILYTIFFLNDGNYMMRIMLAEISDSFLYSGRQQYIRFEKRWTIKGDFNPESEAGGKYRAYELYYYPIITNNKKTVEIGGYKGDLAYAFTSLEIINSKFLGLAIINGLCFTSFYKCTEFCNDPTKCNKDPACFYDYKISHCVPKSHHEIICRKAGGDKSQCERMGCKFCCAKLRCEPAWDELKNCNDGCRTFCTDMRGCQQSPLECMYNPATKQCTDKPYDKTLCPTYDLLHDSLFTEMYIDRCKMDHIRGCVRIPYGINLGGIAYQDDGNNDFIQDPFPILRSPYVSDIDVCGYVDGDYTLILKFKDSGTLVNPTIGRVFDIFLNEILIKRDVNIVKAVGRSNRYEIVTPFKIRGNVRKIELNGQSKPVKATRLHLRFLKKNPGKYDWPIVSAIQVVNTRKCDNELNREQCMGAGCFHNPSQKTCEFQPEIICNVLAGKFCDLADPGIGRQTAVTVRDLGCLLPEKPYPPF